MADAPPPLLLRVLTGPGRAGFALLRAGQEISIGRDEQAGICLEDPLVSRNHAAVRRDADGRCWLRDLGSRNGTRLDGDSVRGEVELAPGRRIEIGGSSLALAMLGAASDATAMPATAPEPRGETALPPASAPASAPEPEPVPAPASTAAPSAPAPPETKLPAVPSTPTAPLRVFGWIEPMGALAKRTPEALPGTLQRQLLQRVAGTRLYALLDGAVDEQVPAALALRGYSIYTLFEGEWAEALAFVGPCLVPAEPAEALVDFFAGALGRHLGILLETEAPLEELVRHLRSVFVATDETGQEYFFRFYDPRVLRAFLPTCTPDELHELFGPIARIYMEDPALPEGLRVASLAARSLLVEELRARP